MHIYSATLQAKPGRGGELGMLLPQLRDAVAEATGSAAYAWAMSAGAPIGTFGISTRVEGMAQLMEFQQRMAGSEAYHAEVAKVADVLAAPSTTSMSQIVGTAGDQGAPAPVVTITQSTMMNGHVVEAMNWSLEILEFVHGVTGLSGLFTSVTAGSFFDVMWIFGAETGAELDSANESLLANPEYMGMIDKAGGLFVPGSANRVTLMQMP